MRYLPLVFVLAFVAITLTESQVTQKSCRAVFSDQNRKQLRWINGCVKQLGYKTGREKTQKSTCVMKCVLNNLQMLNEQGFMDVTSYNKYLLEEWPEHLRDRANTTFQPCLKIGGEANNDDEFCKGYDPLVKCLTRNFSNLCRGL